MLDEITKNEIPKVQENQNDQPQQQKVLQPPTSVVIRSTRLSKPPE